MKMALDLMQSLAMLVIWLRQWPRWSADSAIFFKQQFYQEQQKQQKQQHEQHQPEPKQPQQPTTQPPHEQEQEAEQQQQQNNFNRLWLNWNLPSLIQFWLVINYYNKSIIFPGNKIMMIGPA